MKEGGTGMAIGDNIKHYRKSQNLTQKQLAERANIAVITLQQYEAGKRSPRPQQLENLAKALNINSNMLIFTNSTELDIFEEVLALTEWEIIPFSGCDFCSDCPLSEDEIINKYALGDIPDACEACEYNKLGYYYLSDGKKFYRIEKTELETLQECLKPYLEFRISELVSKKPVLNEKQFRREEYGES